MAGTPVAYSDLAERAGLSLQEAVVLGPLTPLLEESGSGTLGPAAAGDLGDGVIGTIGALTYKRNRTFRFHAAVTEIPESTEFAPRLFCVRKGRVTRDDEFYGFGARHSKVWTESVALAERYTVTTGPYQDPNWMRQLLSPSRIDWLVSEPPAGFSFELAYGTLLCSTDEDNPGVDGLAALAAATSHLGRSIRAECREGVV